MTPLQKSARRYLRMMSAIPFGTGITKTPQFRGTADYLKTLEGEYGRDRVRAAIEEAKR